jgi:NTP pyrophosphatase (non-canonical NTP hydrolase)
MNDKLGFADLPVIDLVNEKEEENRILHAAIERYGAPWQTDMMIEEMSELTKAILKNRRGACTETVDAVLEEMADVEIMLDQMKMIFGSCAIHRRLKVRRLANRLGMKGEIEQ